MGTVGILLHQPDHAVVGGQGATLPYTEIEAENAATNGTIIGPDFTFTHLASEASGRKAVTLHQGHYVEFTLPRPANAIDVRYKHPRFCQWQRLDRITQCLYQRRPSPHPDARPYVDL